MTLVLVLSPYMTRMVRTNVREVLQQPMVRSAILRGLPTRTVIWRHVVPNAAIPVVSVVALTLADIIAGIVVVETVFAFPGIGQLFVSSVLGKDVPVVQAVALVVGLGFVDDQPGRRRPARRDRPPAEDARLMPVETVTGPASEGLPPLVAPTSARGRRWSALRAVSEPLEGKIGICILAVFAFVVVFGPALAPHGINEIGVSGPGEGPQPGLPLGTDSLGPRRVQPAADRRRAR